MNGLPWFDEQAVRLERRRVDAVHALAEDRLAMGEAARRPGTAVIHGPRRRP